MANFIDVLETEGPPTAYIPNWSKEGGHMLERDQTRRIAGRALVINHVLPLNHVSLLMVPGMAEGFLTSYKLQVTTYTFQISHPIT